VFDEQHESNPVVEKVENAPTGQINVYFRDGSSKSVLPELKSIAQGPYGLTVSLDGKTLFVASWYTGVDAYDIDTGRRRWHYRITRTIQLIAYAGYIIVVKDLKALLKIDIESGSLLGTFGGYIESIWPLPRPYIVVNSLRGKISIFDTEKMCIAKSYPKSLTNPNDCLTHVLREAKYRGHILTIEGFERFAHRVVSRIDEENKYFTRIIDRDLKLPPKE
jgi:hypothetical protein